MEYSLIEHACSFATEAHKKQFRKYGNEPYITHPRAVVEILSNVYLGLGESTQQTLAAAWLHDVVEDTPCTILDIFEAFGNPIAGYVCQLTKTEEGNRATRKKLDRIRLSGASSHVQNIKLADVIHNSQSIIINDPKFAKTYVSESKELVKVLHDGNLWLIEKVQNIIAKYEHDNGS